MKLTQPVVLFACLLLLAPLKAFNADEKTLFIVGSTSAAKIVEITRDPFFETTGYTILKRSIGSDKGVISVAEKVSELGIISRFLQPRELEKWPHLTQVTIAQDAISFMVNPKNSTDNVTSEQVRQIYTGDLTKWQNNEPISPYSKAIGHGTHSSFLSYFELESMNNLTQQGMLFKKTGINHLYGSVSVREYSRVNQAVGNVFRTNSAIAYESLGAYQVFIKEHGVGDVKLLSLEGVSPIVDGKINPKYPFKRPINIIINVDTSPTAKAYIDFLLSEQGQQLLAENYFIPVK